MDVDQEAEGWALCATSLKVLSGIEAAKEDSSMGEHLKNQFNMLMLYEKIILII